MKLHELFNGIDDTFGLENEFRSDYVDTDKIISMTNEKLGISQKKPFPKIISRVSRMQSDFMKAVMSVFQVPMKIYRLMSWELLPIIRMSMPC